MASMRYYDGPHHQETPREELASTITHGLGVGLAVAALVLMVGFAAATGGPLHTVTLAVFGAALVAVYLASALYHGLRDSRWRRVAHVCDHVCDHACIYLLIAGTYTPFMLVTLGGAWGWSIFGVMWGLAITGAVLKLWFAGRLMLVSTAIYVAMGWMAMVCGPRILEATSAAGLAWLVAGGLAYTAGVSFYLWHHLPFNHAIWHLFVIAGSACHVVAAFHDVLTV